MQLPGPPILRTLRMMGWSGWPALALSTSVLATPTPTPALFPLPTAADRVLVVAPHPDDETLCCAGLLQAAASAGAITGVVWVTAGDAFRLDGMWVGTTLWPGASGMHTLGVRRLEEAHQAADLLGIARARQYVLGYPDGGLTALEGPNRDLAYRSPATDSTEVNYVDALSVGAQYTGRNLVQDLSHVIDMFQPTIVLAAAPEDTHADHNSSGRFVREVLRATGNHARLYYWIVHAPRWPWPPGQHADLALLPPANARQEDWQVLPLTHGQLTVKYRAMQRYASQMAVTGLSMRSFIRANEIFAHAH